MALFPSICQKVLLLCLIILGVDGTLLQKRQSASTAILYSQGTWSYTNGNQSAMIDAAQRVHASGFTTLILGQFHVHANGTVFYNDDPLDSTLGNIKLVMPVLKAPGGNVQKVLVTFGGAPAGQDYIHMVANQVAVQQQILQLQSVGVDGVDWDIEEPSILNQTQIDNLTLMTNWATSRGLMVTAAPYNSFSNMYRFWGPLLDNTNRAGFPGFSWFNLQTYGGACPPDWFDGLAQNASWLGNTQAFLKLFYGIKINGGTPSTVETDLAHWKSIYTGLSGGGIWQFEELEAAGYTVAQYANSIFQGVGV